MEKGVKQAEVARVVEGGEMTIMNWERLSAVPISERHGAYVSH